MNQPHFRAIAETATCDPPASHATRIADCVDGSLLFRYSDEDPGEAPEERRSPSSEAQADIGGEWANGNGSVNWVLTTDGATEEQADTIEDAVYVPPTAEGDVCTSEP